MIFLRSRLYWIIPVLLFIGLNIYSYYSSEIKGIGFPFLFLEFGSNNGLQGTSINIEFIPSNILLDIFIFISTVLFFYYFVKLTKRKSN
ncbi:hypothetical protein C8N37_103346 [Sphingobacterium faecium]|nr:hypothetical protein C8N37_103346 [Sphingobacterium faecium]